MESLTITRPDDWHLHLRDGTSMTSVVGHTARQFARAVIMPNLLPPITTVEAALEYRRRILDALPAECRLEPLMTLYLTEQTTREEIIRARGTRKLGEDGAVVAAKLYPAGATTNSDSGVREISRVTEVLDAMQECDLPLLVHGEVTDPDIDIFDREMVFIDRVLEPLRRRYPALRIVLEHITTSQAVDLVREAGHGLAATITVHHLMLNRNAIFRSGIRPHAYCLPILKRERHRQALLTAATSGDSRFFLGTDSAPHGRQAKESPCGCAGIFSAHAAIPILVDIFEKAGALHRLEPFVAHHGADFYRLPRNSSHLELVRRPWVVPDRYPFGDDEVIPLAAGETLAWQIAAHHEPG